MTDEHEYESGRRLPWRRRRRLPRPGSLTDRGRALVAAGVTLTACGVVLGFVDLTRMGMLALALPLLTFSTYRLTRPRLDVERKVSPGTLTVGQRAEVELTIRNRSGYHCLTTLAEERLPETLGGSAQFAIPGLPARSQRRVHYAVHAHRRGRHRLGPLAIHAGDPFGLTTGLVELTGSVDVIALPRVHVLEGSADVLGGAGTAGSSPQIVGISGVDDAALRSYHIGDDLRRIHWPVTAHRGELTVRQEGRSPVRSATLILDPHFPGPDATTGEALEWSIEALASIATHLSGLGYSLRLILPDDARRGRRLETLDLFEIVRLLALVEAPSAGRLGSTGEDAVFLTAAHEASVGSGLVVLVAGTHDAQRVKDLLSTLTPGIAGLALLVESARPAGHRARPGDRAGGPQRLGDAGTHELVRFAASGGWRTRIVDSSHDIGSTWAGLLDVEVAR